MTAETLEQKVEKKSLRASVADTFSFVTFGIAYMAPFEYFIVGLEPGQIVKSRAIASAVNIATGRPYGLYRDYFLKKTGTTEKSSKTRKFIADTGAMLTFGLPMYASILYLSGADAKQIALGCLSVAPILATTGWPYGWYLDKVRKLFGVKPNNLENKLF